MINKVGGNIAKKEQEKPGTDGTVGENPGCYSNSDPLWGFLQVIPRGDSTPPGSLRCSTDVLKYILL